MNKICVHRWLCIFVVLLATTSNCFSQAFVSDPGIPNPTITFLNDSVVRLDYDSIYHVHNRWDPNEGTLRGVKGSYDYNRLFADLMTVVDAREYHSIAIYSDDDFVFGEVPGWIHFGSRNKRMPKNIGFDNSDLDVGDVWPERGKNMSMSHMNDVEFLEENAGSFDSYGTTARFFHEFGHNRGICWNTAVASELGWSGNNWEPWMPTICLIAGGAHWLLGEDSWANPDDRGILSSAPMHDRWNIFDLYAFGILSYDDLHDMDTAIWARDPATGLEYRITVDSLISTLAKAQAYLDNTPQDELPTYLQGDEYMESDGRRIPASDPEMQNLKTLVIVVTGKESIFTKSDRDRLTNLARRIPPDWSHATYGLSSMSTALTHRMVNDFDRYLVLGYSVSITWQHFVSAYGGYKQASPDGIRIETLPTRGTLSFNGLAVAPGQIFTPADFAFGNLIYTRNANKKFIGDEFRWNAITQGRWAVAARVNIKPFTNSTATIASNIDFSIPFQDGLRGEILTAFPNPFDDIITLTANEQIDDQVRIDVLDESGQVINSTKASRLSRDEKVVIDLTSKHSSGILYLSVTIAGRTQTKHILRK